MQSRSREAGRRAVVFVCVWLVLGAWGARALAEPYFAVRGGYKCSQCHTNITGGGKRNDFGLIYSQTTLPYTIVTLPSLQKVFGDDTPSAEPADFGTFLSATIGGFLSFGGDFRLENRTVLEEGPVETQNSFNITEANLYVEANLLGDFLTLYIDERLEPGGAGSREIFGLLRLLRKQNLYVKGGMFLLPYGLRLQDDSAFIRERTGISYATPDTGVEFGIEPGPLTFSIAVTDGDADPLKRVTLRAAAVFRHWRLGSSFGYNDTGDFRRVMYGPFAGLTVGRFTLLGEIDFIEDRDEASGSTTRQLATFTSLNFLIVRGVNFKVSYEFLDPDRDIDEDERTRLVIGLEPFLTQFLQVRLFYRLNDDIPQRPTGRADELRLEMHVFF